MKEIRNWMTVNHKTVNGKDLVSVCIAGIYRGKDRPDRGSKAEKRFVKVSENQLQL